MRFVCLTVIKSDSFPAIREIEVYCESVKNTDDFRFTAYLAAEELRLNSSKSVVL